MKRTFSAFALSFMILFSSTILSMSSVLRPVLAGGAIVTLVMPTQAAAEDAAQNKKSRVLAGFLAILLVGFHQFYSDNFWTGIIYLASLFTGIGTVVVPILSLMDAVAIFSMTDNEFNAFLAEGRTLFFLKLFEDK